MRALGSGRIRRIGGGVPYGPDDDTKELGYWHLATDDDYAAVSTAGYFNPLSSDIRVGEFIFAAVDLDASPQGRVLMCTANDGTNVTVALATQA